MIKVWTEGPVKRIEPDDTVPAKENVERTLHMARNSYESYQILLHGDEAFEIRKVDFAVSGKLLFRYNFQETIAFEKESFQDPLSNESTWKTDAGKIQSIWITVYVGEEIDPGSYEGTVTVRTSGGNLEMKLTVCVHRAVLPRNAEAAFMTEYWMHTVNFWFHFPNAEQLDFLKYYYGCEKYSDAWWDVNRKIAQNMKENRINVLFVRTLDLLLDDGIGGMRMGIGFLAGSCLTKFIEFFEEYADVRLFAGYHLIVQTEGKRIYLLKPEDGRMQVGMADIGSEEADDWMRQYLTALYTHLGERGWRGQVAAACGRRTGRGRFLELWQRDGAAVYAGNPVCRCRLFTGAVSDLQGQMDLWIPRVDTYECNKAFYDYRLSQGELRWTYNCNEPYYQNYMNKFLGWPLIHNRALPWACFTNHFNGFLHWGYDYWDPDDEYFGLNPKAVVKGDGYIVYPDGKNGGVKNSVRMTATRDGAQDFELLKLLADKDPAAAYEKSRRVAVRFNDFNWDPENLEQVRREILEALDAK